MAFRIFTNLSALNAQRSLDHNSSKLGSNLGRIASGDRIQRGADDSAALSISERLRSDTRVLKQASRNASDGTALIRSAEGSMNEISDILIRMREMANQSATGTIGDTERQALQLQFTQLRNEIDRIATSTEFNGQKLIDGTLSNNAARHAILHVGLNSSQSNLLDLNQSMDITSMTSAGQGIDNLSVADRLSALTAVDTLGTAVKTVTKVRARVSTVEKTIIHTVASLDAAAENMTRADSSFRDTDMGEELAEMTKNKVITQASTAMVAQANLMPRAVLSLIR